jgi:hypothetical protein
MSLDPHPTTSGATLAGYFVRRPDDVVPCRSDRVPSGRCQIRPALALFYVVLSGLWLVPDSFAGMYGNFDGHWASWNARGILEWSAFLDFSPFSPLVGTGSVFAPNVPWLNPGALALAIPAPLLVRHLVSMLIYLMELSASLCLLYRPFGILARAVVPRDHALYLHILSPFLGSDAISAVVCARAHERQFDRRDERRDDRIDTRGIRGVDAPAVFRLSVFRGPFRGVCIGARHLHDLRSRLRRAVADGSHSISAQRRMVVWRWSAVAFALLVLALIGVPRYLAATAMTSARGDVSLPFLHPSWRLLSPAYWQDLVTSLPLCSNHLQLMCPWAIIGWFEIAVLAGAVVLAFTASGIKLRYALVIIFLLVLIHLCALLSTQQVLGRLHTVSTPYLMWAFFPLAAPALIAGGGVVAGRLIGRRAPSSAWLPAVASCLIAVVAMPIIEHLQQHIGMRPGDEFRGYAATFLGARTGWSAS